MASPIAVTGLLFGVLGQVDRTINWAKLLKEHYRNKKKNPLLCEQLLQSFNNAKQTLELLTKSGKVTSMSQIWRKYFENMKLCFIKANSALEKLGERLKSSSGASIRRRLKSESRRFVNANKSMEVLKNLEEELDMLERDSMHLDGFAMIQDLLKAQHGETSKELGAVISALKGQETTLDRVEANLADLTTRPDCEFHPTFLIPKNPPGVSINLDDPNTLEGALRSKILDESHTSVGSVGDRNVWSPEFAVKGLGGVGKTCALKAIGGDPKVQDCYSGGVYFFSLGQDVKSADVIDMIAEVIEGTGGAYSARKVRKKGKVLFAMQMGAKRFNGKRCLFVCDDFWRTRDNPQSYLHDFESLVLSGSKSSVLFSTRDHGIGDGLRENQVVIFAGRSDDEASSMLRRYASVSSVASEALDSFNFVLKICGGLPVALAVAGRGVKSIVKSSREVEAWTIYQKRLQGSVTALGNVMKRPVDGYSGLFTAISASLEGAGYLAETEVPCAGETIKESFRALCVLRKQAWIPQSALSCLWSMTEETIEVIAELMAQLSLVNIERRYANKKSILGIKLHDLVHEFCVLESRRFNEVSQWNSRLLDGYKARCSSPKNCQHGDDDGSKWWMLEDDNYLHANLAHHFAESDRWLEFQDLLLSFRWTCRQLGLSGFLVVANEFQRLSDYLTSSAGSLTLEAEAANRSACLHQGEEDKGKEIGLIAGAIRLSWPRVTQDGSEYTVRELAFQMRGRLSELALRFPLIERYLGSVSDAVEKPWVNLIRGRLEAPRGSKGTKFHMNGSVYAILLIPNTNFVVAGDNNGDLRIFDIELAEMVKIFEGHEGEVSSVAVSQDGRRIVSGSWDETIRIWDMETGKAVGEPLQGHEERVTSVAVSGDGQLVVSGSWDKTVRIWDMETGKAVGEPLQGHKDVVGSVAVSRDGRRIVSGSDDKTVRIWDIKTGNAIGKPLQGHGNAVTSAVVSGDGRQIVSGSCDRTVRIWDMETGLAIGDPLRGHGNVVSSVAVSRDGRRIASGSHDNTVRIWDMETGKAVGEPFQGHEDAVTSVALSGDGRQVVSGSDDKTARIWNIEGGKALKEPLQGHEYAVASVAVSGDGRLIASGSYDKTAQIWDMETGIAVGKPLQGHENAVMSVGLSGDGRLIVSGSMDKTVRIWDVETSKAVGEPMRGHSVYVRSVAVSEDGQRIVSEDDFGETRCWDIKTGKALEVEEALRSGDLGVAFAWREGLFCEEERDAVYYGYLEGAEQKVLKMGSFDLAVQEWVVDVEKKLWAVLTNGMLVVVRLVE